MGLKKRIETGPGGPYFFPLPRSLASFIVSAGIGCTNLTKIDGKIQQPAGRGGANIPGSKFIQDIDH